MNQWIEIAYVVASVMFILGIKMMGDAGTAKKGNILSAWAMLLAVVVTLWNQDVISFGWIAVGIFIGTVIGIVAAKRVALTEMPELVALFNGFGGLASLLVGWAEVKSSGSFTTLASVSILLTVWIGAITFIGSKVAYLKLAGKMPGRSIAFPGMKWLNILIALAIIASGVIWMTMGIGAAFYVTLGLALVLGFLAVIPIGGGDMPVVISLLNSCSGLAACAAGFVIVNNVLIVAGCLVGTSGLILTVIMCKAMNRTLSNVLFGGFKVTASKTGAAVEGEMKGISAEDAYYVLEAAQQVVIVPGYGMAVAQAQHAAKELGEILEANGTEVRYCIHPVAGRMPGHMNVLLAEADVPYEQLHEMDDVNPTMEMVDVAIVVGANDVVNPSAADDETSPIYGMPIINTHEARTVFVLKRGKGAGFSGLENSLFFRENTRMIYGDAKATLTALIASFKG